MVLQCERHGPRRAALHDDAHRGIGGVCNAYNELSTYAAEMFSKFVMGNESLDNFAKYQDNLKALGLDTVLQLQTTALERYNSRVQ